MSSLNDLYPEETDTSDDDDDYGGRKPITNDNNRSNDNDDKDNDDDDDDDDRQQDSSDEDEDNVNAAIASEYENETDEDSFGSEQEIKKGSNSTSDAYLESDHTREDKIVQRGTKATQIKKDDHDDIDGDNGYVAITEDEQEEEDKPESFHDEHKVPVAANRSPAHCDTRQQQCNRKQSSAAP